MTAVDSEMKPSWYKDPTWTFKEHYLPPRVSQWLSGKESACNVGNVGLNPGLGRSPGEGMATLPGESHGQRIPWQRIPSLSSTGWQRVEHDSVTKQQNLLPRLFRGS